MDNDKWLTLEELAEYLKMGRTKLYRMAQASEIPASKVGSQWRFDREEINAWMKALGRPHQPVCVKNPMMSATDRMVKMDSI